MKLEKQNKHIVVQNEKLTLQTDASVVQSILLEANRLGGLGGDVGKLRARADSVNELLLGYASEHIKSILKFRFSSVNEQTHNATGKFKSKENPFSFELSAKKSCEFDFELNVNDINFKTTRKLKDLSFIVNVSSAGENCQMAFTSKLIFNDSLRKETWNYLIFASLITIFDLLVILLVIVRFEGHDHVCNSQSVIFWTGIGMLNCLFCFVNISFITVEFSKITYFLVIAIANFVNFSLIVLRVLHKIGRVQLSALLNDEVS